MSRWGLVFLFVLACSSPKYVQYSVIYAHVPPAQVIDSALRVADEKGYATVHLERGNHTVAFVARPRETDMTGAIQVAFRVSFYLERQSADGNDVRQKWNVIVIPTAFANGVAVGDDKLPGSAESEARALANAMRAKARHWEAMSL